ncbi:MAG: hypothetical protein BZY87_01550 [SAR202 cluster bacterium Io17-Chloro-G6]|nr:MAG: hypothetical protein BZY87_01550 [SAR202 cluster bacterium Io17-Chloro-G6]
MAQAGLFQLYVPRVIGGPETDPITAFRAVEELSRVDGSVGWCSFVASAVSPSRSRQTHRRCCATERRCRPRWRRPRP